MKLSIKKGDNVIVRSGADKGKIGRVIRVDEGKLKVLVEGINIRKKAVRPSQSNPDGGIVSLELPIAYSNVTLIDKNGKGTRIRLERVDKEGKVVHKRIATSTGEEV